VKLQGQETEMGPFLSNAFGDNYLYDVNRNTFKNDSSETLYKKRFKDSFLEPGRLNFFIGTDSGLLLNYLCERELPEGSRYVFIEIPSVIRRLQSSGKLNDLSDQIMVLSHEELWEKQDEFQLKNYIYIDKIFYFEAFCTLNGYMQIYRELSFTIKVELENIVWSITAHIGKATFIECQLKNICEFQNFAADLKNRFKGKNAILLAGGPTLDAILPWLRDNIDKVVVFAVSRICGQLRKAGIKPHFIFSVDPQDLSYEVSKEMLYFGDYSIFVYSYHVSPLLLGQWFGRSALLGPLFPWKTPLNGEIFESTGPTVTNAAFQTAIHMGFKKIIFGGVDFCFDPSGYTHASGSIERAGGPSLGNTNTVKTNGGRMAESSPDYISAMQVMDFQAGYAAEQGCRVINPAEYAAELGNVDYIPLDEIQLDPLGDELNEELFSLFSVGESKDRVCHYQKALKELFRIDKRMVKIRRLAREALKCNDGLFGRKGMKADFKYKVKMDKIEKQLNHDFSELYTLVKQNGAHKLLCIARVGSEQEWSDKDVERIGRDYYQACLTSVDSLRNSFKDARKRIKMRLEEEVDTPDLNKLTKYWRGEKQLGRIRVWKKLHQDKWTQLNQEEKDRLLILEQEFENSLADTETPHLRKRKEIFGLHRVSGGARNYFKAGDEDGLARLQDGLAEHQDREKSEKLALFVAGLQEELADEPEAAMEKYHQLIGETQDFLTEEALLRILVISLEIPNLENARVASECLYGISVTYLPHYVNMLRLTNDKFAALDVYADYLEKVGSDVPVMLELGQLYLELDIVEGTRLMCDSVLTQEPENQAALQLLSTIGEKTLD